MIMKKIMTIIITVALAAILLAACGKPQGMSKETYNNGKKALEIMDKYNDADITKEEALSRLEDLEMSLDNEAETLEDVIEKSNNTLVSTEIFFFISSLKGTGTESTYDIAENLRGIIKR